MDLPVLVCWAARECPPVSQWHAWSLCTEAPAVQAQGPRCSLPPARLKHTFIYRGCFSFPLLPEGRKQRSSRALTGPALCVTMCRVCRVPEQHPGWLQVAQTHSKLQRGAPSRIQALQILLQNQTHKQQQHERNAVRHAKKTPIIYHQLQKTKSKTPVLPLSSVALDPAPGTDCSKPDNAKETLLEPCLTTVWELISRKATTSAATPQQTGAALIGTAA